MLIDADMIVTRPLTGLIETRRGWSGGGLRNDSDRYVAEWGELLGLGTARRGPTSRSGLVFVGGELGVRGRCGSLDDRQRRIDFDDAPATDATSRLPLHLPEQDVLNAIIAHPRRGRAARRDQLARSQVVPPFEGLSVVDARSLRCADRGRDRALLAAPLHGPQALARSHRAGRLLDAPDQAAGRRRRGGQGPRAPGPAPPPGGLGGRPGAQASPGRAAVSLARLRAAVGSNPRPSRARSRS